MRADLLTPAVPVEPGQPVLVELEVLNTTPVIDQITVELPDVDSSRYDQNPLMLTLFPDERARVVITLRLPKAYPAGRHELRVRVIGRASGESTDTSVELDVQPLIEPVIESRPVIATGGRSTGFDLQAGNAGNTRIDVALMAIDPDQVMRLTIDPAVVTLDPGETATARLVAKRRRRFIGSPTLHPITVTAEHLPEVATTDVQFRQKAFLPMGAITVFTLLLVLVVWATAVIVGSRIALATPPPKKTLPATFVAGLDPAKLDPAIVGAEVSGLVVAHSTGAAVPRATIEVFDAKGVRAAAGATKDDGTFKLPAVPPGRYTIAAKAAGYDTAWFSTPTGATPVPVMVVAGAPLALPAVALVGGLRSMSGTVIAGDGTSTVITATIEALDLAPAVAAVTTMPPAQKVPAGTAFRFTGLPTPATYRIHLSAPNFQTADIQQQLPSGTDLVLNTTRLAAAKGTIKGTVGDAAGPLGDVTITTSVNGKPVATTTPTDVGVGTYQFTGLPSPATYLLTFTKDGYAPTVIAAVLGPGGSPALDVTLTSATATQLGSVLIPDATGALHGVGGVTVAVVGGATPITTTTFTDGLVGAFRLRGLPVPGTYTISFSLPGYNTETVGVTVVAGADPPAVQVALTPSLGAIHGTVKNARGGFGGVTVDISDGITTRTVSTASSPADSVGAFVMPDLPPGAYTITAKAPQYATQTILVQVVAGQAISPTITLATAP